MENLTEFRAVFTEALSSGKTGNAHRAIAALEDLANKATLGLSLYPVKMRAAAHRLIAAAEVARREILAELGIPRG